MKKYLLGLIFAVMVPVSLAYAATPTLTASGTGDNNNVRVQVAGGEINSSVVLFYNRAVGEVPDRSTLGTTDMNGNWSGTVSTAGLGISQSMPVFVQVGGYQSQPINWPYNSGSAATSSNIITFSPASPNFSIGQNGTVTLSGGGSGTYYIASNSSPNWTSASISGNTLTLNSSQMGQSSVTVCSTSGPCAVVTPNFNFTNNSGSNSSGGSTTGPSGSPTLSASAVNVAPNGQGSITLSGGTSPYTVSMLNGNNISTTLIGNTLYVNGGAATGTAMLNVCSAATGTTSAGTVCTPLTVYVQGQSQGQTGSTQTTPGALSFTLPLATGEMLRLSLNGGSGSYYVQSSGTTPVMASVNGNMLTLTGSTAGSTTLNVCSGGTSSSPTATCLPITVNVGPALTGTGGGYLFETNLSVGMSGQDVTELQNRLHEEGYFNVTPTGYFGPLTASAVRAYQAANGLPSVGIVGPQTRALLNQ